MERDGFIFYRSFFESLQCLDDKDFRALFNAICEYGLYGNETELTGLLKTAFLLLKPQIDANNTRYENGKKGGAPKGNSNAKKKSENNLNQPNTTENNLNQPKDKVKDKEKEKVKDNVNDKEKEEKEKSSAFFESFIDLYEIKPDISSLTVVRDLDFKKVLKAWGESKWLKTEIKSLRWVVNNYQKIINGEYKDRVFKAKEEEPKEESEYEKKRKKNLEIIKKSSHEWGFDSGVANFLGLDLAYVQEGDLPISIEQYKRETA